MLKKHELATPTSCLNKAAPDEMVFVLRGKDPHAPQAVRLWADMSEGEQEPGKLAEARAAADAMDKWRIANQPPEAAPDVLKTCNFSGGACRRPAAKGSNYCADHCPPWDAP